MAYMIHNARFLVRFLQHPFSLPLLSQMLTFHVLVPPRCERTLPFFQLNVSHFFNPGVVKTLIFLDCSQFFALLPPEVWKIPVFGLFWKFSAFHNFLTPKCENDYPFSVCSELSSVLPHNAWKKLLLFGRFWTFHVLYPLRCKKSYAKIVFSLSSFSAEWKLPRLLVFRKKVNPIAYFQKEQKRTEEQRKIRKGERWKSKARKTKKERNKEKRNKAWKKEKRNGKKKEKRNFERKRRKKEKI